MGGDRVAGVRTRRVTTIAVALLLLVTACTDPNPEPEAATTTATAEPTTPAPLPVSEARLPETAYTLIPATDAHELAIGVSRTFLTGAQVAVLAPSEDRDAVLQASSLGAAVGAPVLLTGGSSGSVDAELERLGVVGVLTVGRADLAEIGTTSIATAAVPDDVDDLGDLFGIRLDEVPLPAAGDDWDDVTALLELEPGQVFAPAPADDEGTPSPTAESSTTESSSTESSSTESPSTPAGNPTSAGELPRLAPPVQIDSGLLLADGEPGQLAAIATALAAGADVTRLRSDVRGSPAVIEQLHETAPASVVGLGTGMGDENAFEWRTATAATGVQLPGGGQLVLPGKRYVALYGSPVTPALGLLGEQGVSETIDRAAGLAAQYQDLTDDTVVPALEIIVTVASSGPGDDGNYSTEWASSTFVPLIEAAQAAGQYVVLDFQPGRTSFLDQIRQYEDLLAYPHVGVALDPEWRLAPDQVHLEQIGSVGIDEVNAVVTYVADFVQERRLPQKLMILHQFSLRMITDRQDLDTSRTEVALLIHADGQGGQPQKQDTWRALHEGAPEGVFWGWKNFVDEDSPMLTPEETYTQVDPVPDFVSYQ